MKPYTTFVYMCVYLRLVARTRLALNAGYDIYLLCTYTVTPAVYMCTLNPCRIRTELYLEEQEERERQKEKVSLHSIHIFGGFADDY